MMPNGMHSSFDPNMLSGKYHNHSHQTMCTTTPINLHWSAQVLGYHWYFRVIHASRFVFLQRIPQVATYDA